jgi:hypothetical protein
LLDEGAGSYELGLESFQSPILFTLRKIRAKHLILESNMRTTFFSMVRVSCLLASRVLYEKEAGSYCLRIVFKDCYTLPLVRVECLIIIVVYSYTIPVLKVLLHVSNSKKFHSKDRKPALARLSETNTFGSHRLYPVFHSHQTGH